MIVFFVMTPAAVRIDWHEGPNIDLKILEQIERSLKESSITPFFIDYFLSSYSPTFGQKSNVVRCQHLLYLRKVSIIFNHSFRLRSKFNSFKYVNYI